MAEVLLFLMYKMENLRHNDILASETDRFLCFSSPSKLFFIKKKRDIIAHIWVKL